MAFSNTLYNVLFKRNSIFVSSILIGSFAFGIGFDTGITTFWDTWNRGKQWKDIRDKYVEQ